MSRTGRVAAKYTGDTLSPDERSERMSRVRNKDTKPEVAVRELVYSMGFRYRLHWSRLPGKPDLVFAGRRKVIFVHGCFWHRHKGCARCRTPKSRHEFWVPKLRMNRERDLASQAKLRKLGWKFLILWECEVDRKEGIATRIKSFLEE